jgi:competence protein ComEC
MRSPRGRWLLVDAGGGWSGGDAGERIVWPYLRRLGGDVVHLAVTHPHLDHVGGAASLVTRAGVDTVWDGAWVAPGQAYRALLDAARRRSWRHVAAGDSARLDGATIRVLAPDSAWMAGLDDPNEASVVLAVEYGRARFLLTGDAETGEEGWLVARYGEALSADVLKVGHHDTVRPRVALVSVGAGNRYGHPSQRVLQSFDARGTHLLRTDDVGTIVISTDGEWIEVRAHGERWRYRAAAR